MQIKPKDLSSITWQNNGKFSHEGRETAGLKICGSYYQNEGENKMKRKLLAGLATGLLMFSVAGTAQATLTTIGIATYGGSDYNLIWDNDNNGNSVIWLDYTHDKTNWEEQNTWAAGLDSSLTCRIDAAYRVDWGDSSWRLPSAGANSSADYNQITSEMGHLFYEELGLQSYPDRDYQLVTTAELNASNFDNLIASWYWSGTEHVIKTDNYAWLFHMLYGNQDYDNQDKERYGLAVRSGQVSAVPVPGAIWLLGSGLTGLAALSRRRRESRV
ncbi:MAG: PEP-CTERM sorting domain-containing protein [Proteobacteria bacterium]|nr:PEP-CTERM sorting domain-containing protein [Pseudomonadota bacterium]MBU4295617.1 PEP-CTERM sorting domain-containing protein [Pseudomonadota bacterium]MCG2746808.1 PEP-CTERM sorting domain-containing protein [Desulfobulbaceae bacterium]